MNVLMISPGFPGEMTYFTRGLAEVGARVIGVGDQPPEMLPGFVREALVHYEQVGFLWDPEAMIDCIRRIDSRISIDRIECLWEPGMLLAARLREAFDLPGMRQRQTERFRDKEKMKQALDAAGIRTPRHRKALSGNACREAAEQIGYPLIVKPIAGAGSADTFRVNDAKELERILPKVRHQTELSVEEFIDGEEFTFDTLCADGRVLYRNVSWYRPQPLIARSVESVSPQTVSLRDPLRMGLGAGIEMGHSVLQALDFRTGFTHMEWFRKADGEVVFGEIAARPPGALSVDLMNYASDIDTFTGWAEALVHGRFSQEIERRCNAAVIFKRALGQGRIRRVEGLERLVARYRPYIVSIDLLPPGASRRNWKQTLLSDGHVIVRHPDLQATLEMADRIGTDLVLQAG